MNEFLKEGTNAYYTHMGVESVHEASVLANEYTWEILEVLRNAGGQGITPKKILEKVREKKKNVSSSKIYALLKKLYENHWVDKGDYVNKIGDTGHKHILNEIAGDILVNDDFTKVIKEKMQKYIEKHLIPYFLEYSKEVIKNLNDDPKTRKWLPDRKKESYCFNCHSNHEALEFFDCIFSIASSLFQESDVFEIMMKKERFASEKYTVKSS